VHNFINASKTMIRKGAISTENDEPVIIPFSMAEGAFLSKGKETPHGIVPHLMVREGRKHEPIPAFFFLMNTAGKCTESSQMLLAKTHLKKIQ